MIVSQAFQIYQTPVNLQEHMLRTAALAKVIVDRWIGEPLNRVSIVRTCAIHDIAKPMNFDLAKQAQFGMSESDIEKLRQLQIRLKTSFGDTEHEATVGIAREVGCDQETVRLIDNLEWKYIPKWLEANDVSSLIPIYCDMRIGPKGILLLSTRLEELKNRAQADDYEDNVKYGNLLEQLIFKNVSMDLNSITDDALKEQFTGILEMELG